MRTGEAVGARWGETRTAMLDFAADIIAGGVVRLRFLPFGASRGSNYAVFLGGAYMGMAHSDPVNENWWTATLPPGTEVGSVEIIDVGQQVLVDADVGAAFVGGWVEESEAADAMRMLIAWTSTPKIRLPSPCSLSSVTISGAARFANCSEVAGFAARAKLTYALKAVGGDRQLSLYAGGQLVAQGSRTGNGAVTLSAQNSSGLSGTATITYTADEVGDIELHWPETWGMHYSHSALTFPRTPEETLIGKGNSQQWLTPALTAGPIYYAVQAIADDGTVEASPAAPSDSPKTVNAIPEPVSNVTITGDRTGPVVHWTASPTVGVTYDVYYSLVDEPVNLPLVVGGADLFWALPAAVHALAGATQATLAAIANWQPIDRTSDWNTLVSGFQTWRDNFVTDWNTDGGAAAFLTDVNTRRAELNAALNAFALAVDCQVVTWLERFSAMHDVVRATAQAMSGAPLAAWQNVVAVPLAALFEAASVGLNGVRGRYLMPNGSVPGTTLGSDASATATRPPLIMPITSTLLEQVTPLIKNRVVRLVVRATDNGTQESYDRIWSFEIDAAGNVVLARPNSPAIESIVLDTSGSAPALRVNAVYQPEDHAAAPTQLQAWIIAKGATPNTAAPTVTTAWITGLGGVLRATAEKWNPLTGFVDVYVAATDGAGQSELAGPVTIFVPTDTPQPASAVSATVIRGEL